MAFSTKLLAVGAACLGSAVALASAPAQAWEPTHPIEIIVPAGSIPSAIRSPRHWPRPNTRSWKSSASRRSVAMCSISYGRSRGKPKRGFALLSRAGRRRFGRRAANEVGYATRVQEIKK